jgi:hypothetical protein
MKSNAIDNFLSVLLYKGGYALIILDGFFDETERDAERISGVSGLLIEKENTSKLTAEWDAVLREHSLPYFRMAECNQEAGVFKGWSRQDCDMVARKMIGIVSKYRSLAIGVSVDENYSDMLLSDPSVGINISISPYSFCCYFLQILTSNWLDENNISGKVAYVFESGNTHAGESHRVLTSVYENTKLRERFRYAGHAYAPKLDNPALQAADMFAWHWGKSVSRIYRRQAPRGDLRALADGGKTLFMHFDKNKLLHLHKSIVLGSLASPFPNLFDNGLFPER